jgi:hypothetical protein
MRITTFGTIACLALATAARAGDVRTQSDKDYDFSKIRTYYAAIVTQWGNEMSEKQVLTQIESALDAKGWQRAPEDAADARVAIHGATETQKELNTFYNGWGGWGYSRWGYGGTGGTSTTTVSEFRQGTLVVDIFDTASKQLVFRGTATDELSDKHEKNVAKVEKATKKMFKDFPPGVTTDKEEAKKKEKEKDS